MYGTPQYFLAAQDHKRVAVAEAPEYTDRSDRSRVFLIGAFALTRQADKSGQSR
jgi:hypothetical protein